MNQDIPVHTATPRHDWSLEEVQALFGLPFNDLLFKAHQVHRQHFSPNQVQVSTLCSIKTGACPEDCAYCPQSVRFDTGLEREALLAVEEVVEQARTARARGATRFCMGAAYRSPKAKQLEVICEMVRQVKALGMETCATVGMLSAEQAVQLRDSGLDYYNHNLDTSPEFYNEIITTRTYDDRLDTIANVRSAGVEVCSGGIIGMGESIEDRARLHQELATLDPHPDSVPINALVPVPGTPLENLPRVEPLELVRMVATARVLMPTSFVRLSAGRECLNREAQILCFLAGANSIFYGEKLLTTANNDAADDRALIEEAGLRIKPACDS